MRVEIQSDLDTLLIAEADAYEHKRKVKVVAASDTGDLRVAYDDRTLLTWAAGADVPELTYNRETDTCSGARSDWPQLAAAIALRPPHNGSAPPCALYGVHAVSTDVRGTATIVPTGEPLPDGTHLLDLVINRPLAVDGFVRVIWGPPEDPSESVFPTGTTEMSLGSLRGMENVDHVTIEVRGPHVGGACTVINGRFSEPQADRTPPPEP